MPTSGRMAVDVDVDVVEGMQLNFWCFPFCQRHKQTCERSGRQVYNPIRSKSIKPQSPQKWRCERSLVRELREEQEEWEVLGISVTTCTSPHTFGRPSQAFNTLARPPTTSHDPLLPFYPHDFPFTTDEFRFPTSPSSFHPFYHLQDLRDPFETPPRLPQTPPASSATFHYLSPSLRANSRRIRRIIEL